MGILVNSLYVFINLELIKINNIIQQPQIYTIIFINIIKLPKI
jgi:hypothetical protein